MALPGWGQFYNRQYLKMPVVYAGLAGLIAAVIYSNDRYRLYEHAALYKQGQSTAQNGGNDIFFNPYRQYEGEYRALESRIGGEIDAGTLREQRDKFRRYRDLSIVGIGLYHALSVLDAYVSAHLLAFDVGEDLSVRVRPATQGVTARVRWHF